MNEEISFENIEGKTIDEFLILEKISSGSSCNVYLSKHIITNSFSAAKVINLSIQSQSSFKGIMREISVYMQICHPNIIKLYRISLFGSFLIFFLEYASNGTLKHYVQSKKGLSEEECNRIFSQILSAIYHIHTHHFLVHRDIKLENILLDSNNNIKIIDFGLSETFYCHTLRSYVGTPGYSSPELIAGTEYGEKCDIWSLGVVLYIALTNMHPFTPQRNNHKLLMKEASNLKPLIGISSNLQDILSSMLEPRVSYRPTILQLIQHPWIKNSLNLIYINEPKPVIFYDVKNFSDIKKFKRNPEFINQNIIKNCNEMGINYEILEEHLKNGIISSETTIYFILSRPCYLNKNSNCILPPLDKKHSGLNNKSKSTPTFRQLTSRKKYSNKKQLLIPSKL